MRIFRTITAVSTVATAVACSTVNDSLDNCPEPKLTLRYVYDRNMEYANAFHAQVKSVALYVYDSAGRFVTGYEASGVGLSEESFRQTLNLPQGEYELVAWCGLTDGSFAVTGSSSGSSIGTMNTSLTTYNTSSKVSESELSPLWHGSMTLNVGELEEDKEETIYLTKDTNNVKVVLQHLNDKPVDNDMFYYMIADANTAMRSDNSISSASQVYYYPYQSGEQTVGANGGEGTTEVGYASMSTARLVDTNSPRLIVVLKDQFNMPAAGTPDMSKNSVSSLGHTIIDIPLNDYILLTKPNNSMSDQEYLDRQSNYSLVFFLDENHIWVNTVIYINSWKIVLNNGTIG